MSSNYFSEALERLKKATRQQEGSRSSKQRAMRWVVTFVSINTYDYKMAANRVDAGILTPIDVYQYKTYNEDPSAMDRLPMDFDWEETPDLQDAETLPGPIVENLKGIYGDMGLTEVPALTGVRDIDRVGAIQMAIFPEGPDAFEKKNFFRTRHKYLESLRADLSEGTMERDVLETFIAAHKQAMDYRYRWAQRIASEAQEAQSKVGKSGRTYLEPWEADLFEMLGSEAPGFMSVRLDDMPVEEIVRQRMLEAAVAQPVQVTVQQTTDPAMVQMLAMMAESQQRMLETLARIGGADASPKTKKSA